VRHNPNKIRDVRRLSSTPGPPDHPTWSKAAPDTRTDSAVRLGEMRGHSPGRQLNTASSTGQDISDGNPRGLTHGEVQGGWGHGDASKAPIRMPASQGVSASNQSRIIDEGPAPEPAHAPDQLQSISTKASEHSNGQADEMISRPGVSARATSVSTISNLHIPGEYPSGEYRRSRETEKH